GIDYRVHNGYLYMSPVPVPEEEIPGRVPEFLERAGHYFANWTELLDNWHTKIRQTIAELEAIRFEPLPDRVPMEWITEGRGLDHLDIPLGVVRDYAKRVRAGEEIERPTAAIQAERDRVTEEYRALLSDDAARAAFDEKLGLSRLVFPYVENHNFYIEHWSL